MRSILTEGCLCTQGRVQRQISQGVKTIQLAKKKTETWKSAPFPDSVKNLPAMQETQVQSLGQEDSMEEEIATHSSILPREIPRIEEPGGLHSMGSQRVGHD